MEVIDLELKGLKLIKPKVFKDSRGFFFESYRKPLYLEKGINCDFVQDNCSFSQKNSLRGLHFQSDPGQDKLVWVSQGKIFDVAVDIRPNSSTFKKYIGIVLDDREQHQFFVPVGFAHGYLVLSDTAKVHYKVSSTYSSESEKGFRYDDPDININWQVQDPLLSQRDQTSPFFKELELC